MAPEIRSSMLGWEPAVIAMVSPSQLNPAFNQRMWISLIGSRGDAIKPKFNPFDHEVKLESLKLLALISVNTARGQFAKGLYATF